MLHSRSIQNYVCASEDRVLILLSAWLLACGLLLTEDHQQLRQHQAHLRQWSRQKSGGDSAVSSEFIIAGMIFHPSRVQS
jgi:hypothetical protein